MSDRPRPVLEASACPFVAFDDDRDRRSDEPDRRHLCFAEPRPAPRALAHQHAYCLSSAFPACPTFQDWARREAARVDPAQAGRPEREEQVERPGAAAAGVAAGGAAAGAAGAALAESGTPPPAPDPYDQGAAGSSYRRDWAAPPPWLGGTPPESRREAARTGGEPARGSASESSLPSAGAHDDASQDAPAGERAAAAAPAFLAGRDRPSGPPPTAAQIAPPLPPADPDRGFFGPSMAEAEPWAGEGDADRGSRAPGRTSAGRANGGASPGPAAGRGRIGGGDDGDDGRGRLDDKPSWEPRRRMEAYPTLKTRMSLPRLGGLGLALIALLVAAVALFFVPMMLAPKQPGAGGGAEVTASPSTAAASPSASASAAAPSPSAAIYVVKAGDTLSRVAGKLGVSLDQLISANPQLKDPNKLQIGDQLNVPTPAPSEVVGESASPSP